MKDSNTGFYIKQITAVSAEKGDASVAFGPGLNIIQGRSDTGKTAVVKCIDYIFGLSNKKTFDLKSFGYTGVIMNVAANSGGEIILKRETGKNVVSVESSVPGIESGVYDSKYNKNSKRIPLNVIWLKLMGITAVEAGKPTVASNHEFQPERLTMRTLLKLLYLDEERIDGSATITCSYTGNNPDTLLLSSLLYLLTGKSFSKDDAEEKKEIKKAKRIAVSKYVRESMDQAEIRRKELTDMLGSMHDIDVEKRTNVMLAALRNTEGTINEALKERDKLYRAIADKNTKQAECDVLLSRFQTLKDQYQSDLLRLNFIDKGENIAKHIATNTTCPFCHNKIEPHGIASHAGSTEAEFAHIKKLSDGLDETIEDVQAEGKAIQEELTSLKNKMDELEKHVINELRPLEAEQKRSIAELKQYMQVADELTLIGNYTNRWAKKLEDLNKEKDSDGKEYHPRDYFDDMFQVDMTVLAKEILQECKYDGLKDARFDDGLFDIEVNGMPKAKYGKGYRSFLNTVVLLMFRRYLYEHAIYDPRMFIIDTPLHGFDEGVDCQMPDSMRKGLFNYFINHQEEGQLIVIENLDHIPELPYEANGATVTTFNKGRNGGLGRYGFLNGVN